MNKEPITRIQKQEERHKKTALKLIRTASYILILKSCFYLETYITSLTAFTTRSAFGKLAAIKVGA
jgi:hypothetical protein